MFLIAIITLSLTHAAFSEDMEHAKPVIGFGVSLVDIREVLQFVSNSSGIAPVFYIPINISSRFRIEPEIGFYLGSSDVKKSDNGWYEKTTDTYRHFHIGVGILPIREINSILLNYGIRAGYIYDSYKSDYNMGSTVSDKTDYNGFYLSPVFGSEYRFSGNFSVGGEVQLQFTNLDGEGKDSMSPTMGQDLYTTSLSTRTLITTRFYF